MSEQTMTGPARLRALTSRNQILSPVTQDEFRQLAAQWEADRAALEAAKSQREAYKLSVYELREQLRHSVSEDALASAQDDLAGCRAALNSETNRADAAELRAHVLGQRDETETMNIGAALFAVVLRDDTGAGEMPAGPCADVLAEWRRLRQAEAALERAANDLMLSEESFVKMRDKRDDVLRELHAKSAALEHANRFLEQETFTRQKYGDQLHATEAALEQAQTQVALYEGRHAAQLGPDGQEVAPRHRYTDEGVCIRCGEDAEEWDAGCVEELAAELEKKAAALERALALVADIESLIEYTRRRPTGMEGESIIKNVQHGLAALLAAAPGGAA